MKLKSFIQFLKEENNNDDDININIEDRLDPSSRIRGGRRDREVSRKNLLKKYNYLKKEPKYIDLFHTFAEKEGKSDQELKDLYKEIQTHRNTLKQNNVDVSNASTYEEVEDELTRMKLIEKTNKFVKLLPSHLRNEMKSNSEYMSKFSNMLIDYSYADYKNSFMRKVSRYKNINEFFEALLHHLESFAPRSAIFGKIENDSSAEVVMSTDDFLVARIYNEKSSNRLGSSQWCISRKTGSYWDSYISGSNSDDGAYPGVQYFIWDFRYNSTDDNSLIGCTKYRNKKSGYSYGGGDGTYVAHGKSDNSVNIDNKDWYKYLVSFDHLTFRQQIKLVSENPKMEKYTGIIDALDVSESKKLLKEVPRLLLFFKDISFLKNEEIWDLVKRDNDLSSSIIVANRLNTDQQIICLVNNPDLLEIQGDNPYTKLTTLLTSDQKITMISNKHSLYSNFKLTEDEKFSLISKDPTIIISHTNMISDLDQLRLKKIYSSDRKRWDRLISSSKSDGKNKTVIELMLKHLIKSDDRLGVETSNKVYVLVSSNKVIDGKEYILPNNIEGILMVGDILDIDNDDISVLLLTSSFNSNVDAYWLWIPLNMLPLNKLKNKVFRFESSYEDIINGNASELDIDVFNHIQHNVTSLF